MADDMPLIAQVSNVSSLATLDQMKKLFGYMGKIKDIRMYPTMSVVQPEFKVCYIKYAETGSVRIALHLTNTVFIDRALVVVAIPGESIPSEDNTSFDLLNPTSALPGLLTSNFKDVSNDIAAVNGNLVITSIDSNLDILGLPQYPPLSADHDPNTIEEIRRTIYIENISPQVTASQLLDFINGVVGEVKYLRMAGHDTNMIQSAFVEFTDRASIVKALQCDGITLKGNKLKIQHSSSAIVKPPKESDVISEKENEEALKRLKEAESLITRIVEPEVRGSSRSHRRSSSRSRKRSRSSHRSPKRDKRSRSRDRRSRSKHRRSSSRRRKSRSRSKTSRSRARRSRSRSKGRRSHSRSRLSRSRSKSRRSKRRERSRSRRSRSKSKLDKRRRSTSRSKRSRSRRRSRSRSKISSRKRVGRSRSGSRKRSERSLSRSRSSRSKRSVRSRSHDSKRSKRSRSGSKRASSKRTIRSRSRSKMSDAENKSSDPKKVDKNASKTPQPGSRSPSQTTIDEIPEKNKVDIEGNDTSNIDQKSPADLGLSQSNDFMENMEVDENSKQESNLASNMSEASLKEAFNEIISLPNPIDDQAEEKIEDCLNIKVIPKPSRDSRSRSKSKKIKSRSRSRSLSKKIKSRSRSRSRSKKVSSRSRSRSRSKLSSRSDRKSSRKGDSLSRARRLSRSPRKLRRSLSRSDRSSSPEYGRSRRSGLSRRGSRSPRKSGRRSSKRSVSPSSTKYKSRNEKHTRSRKKSRSITPDKRSKSRSPRRSIKGGSDAESSPRKKLGISRERKGSYDSDVKASDSE